MAALACAVLTTVVVDILTPGAGPLVQPLSAFASTASADLWTVAVESAAIGIGLLAVTAYHRGATPTFVLTLGIAGGGLAVSGIVAADPWFPWEQTPTLYGQVHVGAVFVTLIALSTAMVKRHHALPQRWLVVRDRFIEVAFGMASGSALLYVLICSLRAQPLHWFGFWERLLLAIALAWCASLAIGNYPTYFAE